MERINTTDFILKLLFITILCFFCVNFSYTQPALPQRAITVTATQSIHFGAFCVTGGAGGTVTVGYDGSRTSSGNIVLLAMSPAAQPAVFEIKLCQGRNVTINFASTTILTGSNGGSLILDIGPTDKGSNGSVFITNSDCNFITPLRVGGTLNVSGTNIPGVYSGNFTISLIQE
jgi:hypothetical protein